MIILVPIYKFLQKFQTMRTARTTQNGGNLLPEFAFCGMTGWVDQLPTATQLLFTSIQLGLKTNDLYPEIEVSQYSVARDFTTRKWIRLSINPIITLGCHRCGKECPLWFYTFRPLKGWQLCTSFAKISNATLSFNLCFFKYVSWKNCWLYASASL